MQKEGGTEEKTPGMKNRLMIILKKSRPADESRYGRPESECVSGSEEFLEGSGSRPKLTVDVVFSAPTWSQ